MRRAAVLCAAAIAALAFVLAACSDNRFWEDDFTTHDGHRVYPEAARACHDEVEGMHESMARREFRHCLEGRGYRYAPSQRFWQR